TTPAETRPFSRNETPHVHIRRPPLRHPAVRRGSRGHPRRARIRPAFHRPHGDPPVRRRRVGDTDRRGVRAADHRPVRSGVALRPDDLRGPQGHRQADGSIASFRPEENAARFNRSARRMAMPPLPEDLFMESLRQIVAIDRDWVPAAGGEDSLYLRPFMIATEAGLGVRPAEEYLYSVIASPAGAYFPRGIAPVSVWLSTEYVRASPGGTGAAKFGGNYAASLLAQEQAAAKGCDQVVWLDAIDRKYVEEMG